MFCTEFIVYDRYSIAIINKIIITIINLYNFTTFNFLSLYNYIIAFFRLCVWKSLIICDILTIHIDFVWKMMTFSVIIEYESVRSHRQITGLIWEVLYYMEDKIELLNRWIEETDNIVFFGGAGVSTESGIPDFRSVDGLYNQQYKYPPESIISRSFFQSNPLEFYRFYRDRMIYDEAKPNSAHKMLARLESIGKLKCVITQNIDGLHQMAGSKNVIELHGSIHRNYCMRCHRFYDLAYIENSEGVPYCECGGIVKPDVVLYEECLNEDDLKKAVEYISNADMLIVGGTSLGVYPAAGLIDYYSKDKIVLINKSATPYDRRANLLINDSIGQVFSRLRV